MPADQDEIQRAVELICSPAWERGDVVELRALNTPRATVSGYFDIEHKLDLVRSAAQWSENAQGVYVTLNPVLRDCLARAANRTCWYVKSTTGDTEITHRYWLLVDADPVRPSGISANDQEHDLALQKVRDIRDWLRSQRFPDPIFADSGNGGHLLYRVDLPAEDGGLLHKVLQALSARFSDARVSVDKGVHNPSRISKLYGTMACKGDSLADRPHRLARLLEVPSSVNPVPRECLEAVADTTACRPASQSSSVSRPTDPSASGFDVVAYLQSHGIEVGKSKEFGDARLWELKRCPWRPDQPDGGPFVIQFPNGNLTAGCHHDQCDGKGWDELRDIAEPGWREQDSGTGSRRGPSVAQRLVALAKDDELFHTAEQQAFVTISRDGHRETCPVKSRAYKLLLRRRLYEQGAVANDGALDDALATLESQALFDGPEGVARVRTAEADGKLYIDLCNDAWEAVEVSADGWRVVPEAPVRFVRREGMLPLPRPTSGGSIEQLRPFINVTDEDWPLVVAWLMAALRPTGPYPILLVSGEQGSAKSTTCERLRSLVDPNSVPLRSLPRDEQVLMIWAANSNLIGLDNVSSVPIWLSDAMCRIATGGGTSQRALYTDDGEKLFFAMRPQLLNGIGDVINRSDFLDRALVVQAPVITRDSRKSEKELDARFAEVNGLILGALLSAASAGLARLPEIEKLDLDLPRLADFAKWLMAIEAALGWQEGYFSGILNRNEADANETAVTGSLVASAVQSFIRQRRTWEGGCNELLDELDEFTDGANKRREGWPVRGQVLSTKLRERAPNLRGVGIDVQFHDNARPRRVTLNDTRPAAVGVGSNSDPEMLFGLMSEDSGLPQLFLSLSGVWKAGPFVEPVGPPTLDVPDSDGTEVLVQ